MEKSYTEPPVTFRIVRRFPTNSAQNHVLMMGLSQAEATAHCENPESASKSCTHEPGRVLARKYGQWYDALEAEA